MLLAEMLVLWAQLRLVLLGLVIVEDGEYMDWFDWVREDKCPIIAGDLLFLFF